MIDINKPELGVKEYFDSILRSLKVSFDCEDDVTIVWYKLFVGSAIGNIQLELSNNLEDDTICWQTWITLEEEDYNHFNEQQFFDKNWDDIEGNIEGLITATKNIIRAKNKIDEYLDKIRETIDQYNLGIDFELTAESILS